MLLIGIGGGSGSGKTTFARKIISYAKDPDVGLLHQDSYYLPSLPEHLRNGKKLNFDHPDAFDWPLLKAHLLSLRNGETISIPTYDFRGNTRSEKTLPMGPCRVVILEGIFALWEKGIRALLDLKIFLDVEADIRFIRRLHRDIQERGRSLDGIIRQYYDLVRPMHRGFIEPTRQFADVTVGHETNVAARIVAAKIELINLSTNPRTKKV